MVESRYMAPVDTSIYESLIASGEGQVVEFKDERIRSSDLAETLVAFANADGGTVLIGVSDDGRVTGVQDQQAATDLAYIAASRDCADPPLVLSKVDKIPLPDGKVVIAVRVPRARTTVHSANGRFLMRQGSRNIAVNSRVLKELVASRHGLGPIPFSAKNRGHSSPHARMYEVLRHVFVLTLLDSSGKRAIFERREKIRFLQDNVIALYDHAWGDGQMFIGYRVTPGKAVDRFKMGARYQTLISLRETKQRGDTFNYRMRQRIIDGFTAQEEWLEVEVDHPTRLVRVTILFPKDRPCQLVRIIEASTNREVGSSRPRVSRQTNGRTCLVWSISRPRLGERYVVNWLW
jgi:hypothetical protein